jgi:hypothetical protein
MNKKFQMLAAGVLCLCFHAIEDAWAQILLSESFENPPITNVNSGSTANQPVGWSSSRTDKTGLADRTDSGGTVAGITDTQFAHVDDYPNSDLFDGALTTTTNVLDANLEAHVLYTLTCDYSGENTANGATMDLLAGTNVLGTAIRRVVNPQDLSANSLEIQYVAKSDNLLLGEKLGVRLRMTAGVWDTQCYFDNVLLVASNTVGDATPPVPAIMSWVSYPTQDVNRAITMQATNATDVHLVEYLFTNLNSGTSSGWQDNPIWTEEGLAPGSTHTYRVKARDKSVAQNETAWSDARSATVYPYVILYESFEEPVATQDLGWGTYPGFAPAGWASGGGTSVRISGGPSGVTTPYGNQVVDVAYQGHTSSRKIWTTGITEVLNPDYTYTLSLAAGNDDGASGVRFIAELFAGTNVVAAMTNETASSDMSETYSLEFIPDSSHPDLGETLRVRMYHADTSQWSNTGIFDNVRLDAVPPPPKGTLLILR